MKPAFPVGPALAAVKTFLASKVELPTVHNPPRRRWAVIQFQPLPDAEVKIPLIAAQLAARPDVRYAEPDFLCQGHTIANDPMFNSGAQWWPQKIGFDDLWTVTQGANKVLLAVLDSGISIPIDGPPDHEDLNGPRYIVANTIAGVVVPHDYTRAITMTSWPFITPKPPRDEVPHGTHVTGIAAALSNNGVGVAGANWKSDVYVARVLDENNNGSASMVKMAVHDVIRFANKSTFNLAPVFPWLYKRLVINLSLGCLQDAESLLEVCEETSGGKVIICAGAGSRGAGDELDFPAAFSSQFDHVISVGSTNHQDVIDMPKLTDYSEITIFAPGVGIPSTTPSYPCTLTDVLPKYASMTGTSQACPIVAGAVSLLWSVKPTLTPHDIRHGLLSCAVPCTDGNAHYPRLNLKLRRKSRWSFGPRLPWN